MATVIDRLVVQGRSPVRGESPRKPKPGDSTSSVARSSGSFDRRTLTAYRRQRALPATTLSVSGQASRTLELCVKRERSAFVVSPAGGDDQPGKTGPLKLGGRAGRRTRGTTRQAARAESADSSSDSSLSLNGDAMLTGGATPIVKKMEYLALVRQAREGITSVDGSVNGDKKDGEDSPGKFVIKGRKVSSQSPCLSVRNSTSSTLGRKKARFALNGVVQDYAVSELTVAGDKLEGHVDQFKGLIMRRGGPGGGGGGGGPWSVKSFKSDSSSNQSVQFPTLTSGSSEPSGLRRPVPTLDSGASTADSEELGEELLRHLLPGNSQPRGPVKGWTTPDENGMGTVDSGACIDARSRIEALNACLSVAGQVPGRDQDGGQMTARGSRSDRGRWAPSRQMLGQPGTSSEGALLFKRHKHMERMGRNGEAGQRRYNFSSVSSYLNFNRALQHGEMDLTSAGSPTLTVTVPGQDSAATAAAALAAGYRAALRPTPRAPGPTPETSPRKGAAGQPLKRGIAGKLDAGAIPDLDEYFTVKTPRIDIKSKPSTISSSSRPEATRMRPSWVSTTPLMGGLNKNNSSSAGDRQENHTNLTRQLQEAPKGDAAVRATTAVDGDRRPAVGRGHIVSVPSANSEHWQEKMTA